MNNMNDDELKDIKVMSEEESLAGARQLLSKTKWRIEALQIPQEDIICEKELKVLQKCIDREDLDDKELDLLETVLAKYRPAINEIKPMETLETYHDNIEYVEDEHAFLELLDQEARDQTLNMYYPLLNGKEAKLELTVKPITDAKAIMDVGENLDLFKDYTQEEIQIYNDYQMKKEQTPEEIAIATKLQEEIAVVNADRIKDVAIEFLALQTTFKDKDSSYEDMKQIYSKMQVGYLLLLFARVKDMTHLDGVETEKIFRQSD